MRQVYYSTNFKTKFQNESCFFILLADVYLQKRNQNGASRYHFHKCTHFCPYDWHLKPKPGYGK